MRRGSRGLGSARPLASSRSHLLFYEIGTARFGVYESFTAVRNEATVARLVVTDFDAAIAELTANGVVFEDYDFGPDFRTVDGVLVSEDGERTAWFKDSEGNTLAIGSSH